MSGSFSRVFVSGKLQLSISIHIQHIFSNGIVRSYGQISVTVSALMGQTNYAFYNSKAYSIGRKKYYSIDKTK